MVAEEISYTVLELDGWTVVRLSGEIDAAKAPELRAVLHEQLVRGRAQLVADLTKVRFVDSSSLGVLIGVLKQVRNRGGDLRLVVTLPQVLHVLHVTGLSRHFAIGATAREAIDAPPAQTLDAPRPKPLFPDLGKRNPN